MRVEGLAPWRTHDWKVRTIESISPGGGSRLAFTCRSCGRIFNQTTINSRSWAVDTGGGPLLDKRDTPMPAANRFGKPPPGGAEEHQTFQEWPRLCDARSR